MMMDDSMHQASTVLLDDAASLVISDATAVTQEKEQVFKTYLMTHDQIDNMHQIKDPDENQNCGSITETNVLFKMGNDILGACFNAESAAKMSDSCMKCQHLIEDHQRSIDRDAVRSLDESNLTHRQGASRFVEDKMQTETVPLLRKVSEDVKDWCQIDKERSQAEQREGTSAPATYCITAGTLPTLEPGPPGSAGHKPVQSERDPHGTKGNPVSQFRQERWGSRNSYAHEYTSVCLGNADLVIEVSGKKLHAHKSVLSEKSDYFKARQSRDVLKVKGVSFKTLTTLMDYIYTYQMKVGKENIVEVINGAKILQVPCAVQAAVDTMSEQITAENCFEILTIAKRQRLNELKEKAYKYMSDNYLQVLRNPAVYGRLTGGEREYILAQRTEGKKVLMVAEINEVYDRVGSRPPSRENSRPQSPLSMVSLEENHMIHYYDEETKEWKVLTKMPDEINTKGSGICTMYNYLFVAGGIKGQGDKGKVSDKVFCYNPLNDSWSEIRPLGQARSQLKLVSMDGYLFAIGGECLFTVEKYDPRMDRWSSIAPLPKGAFAVAHEATTCNGELFVSGGSLFYRLLRYDTRREEWEECPFNNSRKKSTDMVAYKNFIYRFDVNRDYGVNVFKYNTVVKIWHESASLEQDNPLPFRCAVIGNRIYCVNKSQTLQFIVEEEDELFLTEALKAPTEPKGALVPFVLALPKSP
ncbi:kelch repeat and BTB domain-containing protein 11-like [Osmerus eperlanus]|uniref:kelch repeat and BTB domain-containing protein 11-like n=1 Tax=Osmerus eperlanus TaxID=29151 RepID=UPI002E13630E